MVLLLLGSVGSASANAPPPQTPAVEPINRIVGDTSWVAHTGRSPSASDDAITRAAVHLAHVESKLSGRDVTHLSKTQTERRNSLLQVLRKYRLSRAFPRHSVAAASGPSLRPRFIDDDGRHCAVGHLIKASGHPALAVEINEAYEYGYLLDIAKAEPRVAEWAESHGFDVNELAMIQPSYRDRPGVRIPSKWESHVSWLKTALQKTPMHMVLPEMPSAKSDARDVAAGLAGQVDTKGRRHGLWVTPSPKVFPLSNAPITRPNQPRTEPRQILVERRKVACKETRRLPDPACANLVHIPFHHGKRHGEELRFDASGRLVQQGTWKGGTRIGPWLATQAVTTRLTYDSKGRIHGKVETKGLRTLASGSYRRGLKHGPWTMLMGSGSRTDRVTGQFVNGVRVGLWQLHRLVFKKDSVLLGSTTYSKKGKVIDFKPEGAIQVKGQTGPVFGTPPVITP